MFYLKNIFYKKLQNIYQIVNTLSIYISKLLKRYLQKEGECNRLMLLKETVSNNVIKT